MKKEGAFGGEERGKKEEHEGRERVSGAGREQREKNRQENLTYFIIG